MKIKRFLLFILVLIVGFFALNFNVIDKEVYADNSSEIVMEVSTNRVLFEHNSKTKKYMASTTKILTAIVVIENFDINKIITVTKETVGVEGSSIYLEVGEKLTVKELLYGLMLRSGNDCAETLAVSLAGSIKNFAELMNETAHNIGATSSNFVNPHGLHDDNHYTTAYDLALISSYAIKNPIFKEIVSTKKIKISNTNRDYDRVLINKNKMLSDFEGATGIKTGFTKKAGRCLVSSCVRNGMELVSVVLNCPPMFERSKELLNDGYNNFEMKKIIESDHFIGFVETIGTGTMCGLYVKRDVVIPLTKREIQSLKIVYDYPKVLGKAVKKDTEIGKVKIYCENNLIFTEKIYTIIDTI